MLGEDTTSKSPSTPDGVQTMTPTATTCPDTCSWYQSSVMGADGKCVCSFSLSNTAATLFMLPGSVVAGFMVKPEPGQDKSILSQNMMVLATAISLVAWGGLGYYLWRRFR